ncbi:4Fe-4S binding protein [Hydrogenimonas thermophila]|uniref:ATP-binding protein n=1 Tax=Hydrogenimonas thermophila TaxID=223786 RepID=UPI0029372AEB|nr:4Fe-4S dicluster-binding protein [Hydrogenimonas thermophila]WOE70221.1 4Fe-4S binding protein [Hydrogenimonas thermophila]WOE72738.1 4Fe-4S binding protein [Hydrogenimonas thermophila]
MREIVIVSGKGGTGKTSISASFAVLEGSNAIISDCDVDAANMHLLLGADFKTSEDFYSGETALIDEKSCTNCGDCFDVCRFDAINVIDEQHRVDPISCEGCWYCSRICPTKSISMIPQKAGLLFRSNIKTGTKMVHAKLGFGAENSGKLVAKVKQEAKILALKEDKEYVITDGSPGIGCPVISSLSGANLVVLVTEATVSGLHDLKRVYKLLKTFNLKAVCIINKFDLNSEMSQEIEEFLENEGVKVVGKLPYDETFTKAMAVAKPIVEFDPDSAISKQLESSWVEIKSILKESH